MKVNGIVAEYNPFHNGHKYLLTESARKTGADYTVVVMSGDFVQRGAPAITDKFSRAQMALACGADLVLELPALYAAASAEFFAEGAVALFNGLNVVTDLRRCRRLRRRELRQRVRRRLHSPSDRRDSCGGTGGLFPVVKTVSAPGALLSQRQKRGPDPELSFSRASQKRIFLSQQYSGD